MIKWVIYDYLRSIWYPSEPSDVPYTPNQQLVMNYFGRFLQQEGSKWNSKTKIMYLNNGLYNSHIFSKEWMIDEFRKKTYKV